MTVRDSEDYQEVYGVMTFHGTQNFTQETREQLEDIIDYVRDNCDDWGITDIVDAFLAAGFDVEYNELPDLFIRV